MVWREGHLPANYGIGMIALASSRSAWNAMAPFRFRRAVPR